MVKILFEQLAFSFHFVKQPLVENNRQCCQRRCAAYGIAAESRDVTEHGVVCQRLHDLSVGNESADGQTAAESFCNGEDIWHDAKMFESKKFPGPPHATLDLVKDKNRACLVAALAHGLHILRGWNTHTGIPLDRFHDDASRGLRYLPQIVGISEFNEADVRKERPKRALFDFVPRHAEAAVRAPMVGATAGDDFRPACVSLGEFEGAFVRFRS